MDTSLILDDYGMTLAEQVVNAHDDYIAAWVVGRDAKEAGARMDQLIGFTVTLTSHIRLLDDNRDIVQFNQTDWHIILPPLTLTLAHRFEADPIHRVTVGRAMEFARQIKAIYIPTKASQG